MNDFINAIMTLQLPFAVIPTIAFTSSVVIMHEFANSMGNKITGILLYVFVVIINIIFFVDRLNSGNVDYGWIILASEFAQLLCIDVCQAN